jgi:hypothetical protein
MLDSSKWRRGQDSPGDEAGSTRRAGRRKWSEDVIRLCNAKSLSDSGHFATQSAQDARGVVSCAQRMRPAFLGVGYIVHCAALCDAGEAWLTSPWFFL